MNYFVIYTWIFLAFHLCVRGNNSNIANTDENPEFSAYLLEKAKSFYINKNDSAIIFIDSCLKQSEIYRFAEYGSECHLLKAKWYKEHNQFFEAIIHIERCIPYYEATNNSIKIAECKFISGYCRSEIGDYENSINELLIAIPIFDSLHLLNEYQNSRNTLAVNFFLMQKYQLAENLWNEIYSYANEKKDTLLLSKTLNNLAIIYALDSVTFMKSIDYSTRSIQLAKSIGDDVGASNNMMNLANMYLNLNQPLKAKALLFEANNLNHRDLNQTQQIYILLNLSKLYLQLNQMDSAQWYIEECLQLSKSIGFKTLMPTILETKASILKKNQKFDDAYTMLMQSSQWKDSLWQDNLASASAEFEVKFEAQKQINEIHIQQAIIEKQQTQLNAQRLKYTALSIILIFFVLLILLYGFYSRKLKKTNDHLTLMNKIIQEKNLNLQKTINMRDRLLSIIAHDIKNPLATISGFAELITLSPDNQSLERTKSFSEQILTSSNNLFDLLDNLLYWTKSQQNGVFIKPETLNVYKLIDKNIKLMELMAQVKNILITNHCSTTVEIFADKASINTVVRNLINNAIKFTPNFGKIDINVEKRQNKIYIHFDDNGQGIHPDDIPLLFNADIDRSKIGKDTINKGIGLGLILCDDFMKLNGGTITVSSVWKQGSRFTLEFPCA